MRRSLQEILRGMKSVVSMNVQYAITDLIKTTGVVQGEKEDMDKLQSTKEEIDRVNLEIQAAERDYDLNRAAELKYGTLLELKKALSKAEEALSQQVHPPQKFHFSCRSLLFFAAQYMIQQVMICRGARVEYFLLRRHRYEDMRTSINVKVMLRSRTAMVAENHWHFTRPEAV